MKRLAVGACLVILVAGCAHRATQSHVIIVEQKVSPWHGVANVPIRGVRNNYVHLAPVSATDLLPCSLAVARVATPHTTSDPHNPTVVLAMSPPNELIGWMELFDDTWLISAVFPVTYPSYPTRPVEPDGLIEQARDGGAGLCLIYRETVHGEAAAEVRGAIYDVDTGGLITVIHAVAHTPASQDQSPPSPPDRVKEDRRHIDPRFVAHDRFRELVRGCVLEWAAQYEELGGRRAAPGQTVDQRALRDNAVMLGADRRP